jgi:hypothetical protein
MSSIERRWARFDRAAGILLIALSSACFGVALLGFASLLVGNVVHPDAVLLPLAAGIPLAGGGALLLLAASVLRRGLDGRWTVQWGAIAALLVFMLFMLLSAL